MDRKSLWHSLRTRYAYRTPVRKRFSPTGLPGAVTAVYYPALIKIIFDSNIIARRGDLDIYRWSDRSVAVMNLVENLGGRLDISGLEYLAEHRGPVVLISNHMSMIDAFFLPGITLAFKDVTFVVKDSLLRYPLFGAVMRAVDPISVLRKNPREDLKTVLIQGARHLNRGRSVIVFPQATRNPVFDGALFNSLGVKLAQKNRVPVIPVALKTDFQGQGRCLRDFGPVDPQKTIHVQFGPGMRVPAKSADTHRAVVAFISENLRRCGGTVRNVD